MKHNRHMKALARRMKHLDQRVLDNRSDKILSYDISEKQALRYAIQILKSCKEASENPAISEEVKAEIYKIMGTNVKVTK